MMKTFYEYIAEAKAERLPPGPITRSKAGARVEDLEKQITYMDKQLERIRLSKRKLTDKKQQTAKTFLREPPTYASWDRRNPERRLKAVASSEKIRQDLGGNKKLSDLAQMIIRAEEDRWHDLWDVFTPDEVWQVVAYLGSDAADLEHQLEIEYDEKRHKIYIDSGEE